MKKILLLLSVASLLMMELTNGQGQINAGGPQTITLQPDADCAKSALLASCVPCGYDNANYGTAQEFDASAGTNGGSASNLRSLMQFDLTAIPAASTVQSATLSLYFDPSSSNGQHRQDPGPNDAYLKEVTAPWDANTVTWDNQPLTTTNNEAYLPASTNDTEDYNIDVTAMMQDFVTNPDANFGMMLQLENETQYKGLIFASGYNVDPALHPKLVITYTPPPPSGCVTLQYASCNGVDALIASCVACGYASMNFGNSEELDASAGTNQGNTSDLRGLIYWDLSSIPTSANVLSADLSLYFDPTGSNGTQHSQQSGPNDAYLNKVTSSWDESTVTWNSQPTTTTANQVHLPADTSGTESYTNINVAALVQDMVTNPSNNYGLMLQLANETGYRSLLFASSDRPNPANHPKLDICYSVNAGVQTIQDENQLSVTEDYATETVTIKSKQDFKPGTSFLIYNSIGQLVGRWNNLTGQFFIINKPGVSDGVYFYSLFNKEQVLNGKLIF